MIASLLLCGACDDTPRGSSVGSDGTSDSGGATDGAIPVDAGDASIDPSCCTHDDCVRMRGAGWRCDPKTWLCFQPGECDPDDATTASCDDCGDEGMCWCEYDHECRGGEVCEGQDTGGTGPIIGRTGAGNCTLPETPPPECAPTTMPCPEGYLCVDGHCQVSCEASSEEPPTVPSEWVLTVGGSGDDAISALAVDPEGNVYLGARFTGTVDLGGGPLSSAGATDVALAKLAPDGSHVWSSRIGGAGQDDVGGVAVGPEGAVYVGGRFEGTIDVDGTSYTSTGVGDGFVASFAPEGTLQWLEPVGGSGDGDTVHAVAAHSSGAVWLAGEVTGTVDLGDGPLETAGTDALLARLDPEGNVLGSHVFGDSEPQSARDVVVGFDREIYAVGSFRGSFELGGETHSSVGGSDAYAVSFRPDGTFRWSWSGGGPEDDRGISAGFADSGLVGGSFRGSFDTGSTELVSEGVDDAFVAELGPEGLGAWSRRIGGGEGTPGEQVSDVHFNPLYVRSYVVGTLRGTTELADRSLSSAGETDAFVASVEPGGMPLWAARLGGPAADRALAVATVREGRSVYVAGEFRESADFAGESRTSEGGADGFVVKLLP